MGEPSEERWPGRRVAPVLLGRLVLGVVLLNLFAGGLVGLSLRHSRLQYDDTAAVTSRNLARTNEQYATDLIDKSDYLLFDTVAEIERQLASGGLDRARIERFLAERQQLLPALEAIRVADASGQVIFGSAPSADVPRNLSDRDYFMYQRDHRGAGLFVSRSHVSRVTGRWSIFFSRRIELPDGGFFGIAYSVLPLDTVEDYFSRIDVGPGGGISLRDDKLAILVRYPDPDGKARGNGSMSPEMQAFRESGASAGTFFSGTTWDGNARMVSIRQIGRWPLHIAVGLAREDYLKPWRDQLRWVLGLYGVFVLATLAWAFLLQRAWRERVEADQQARENLERRVAEKTAHLSEYATALERSNADLEQFAYVASHDLREPLRMVSSYLGLLERRYGTLLDHDGHDFIEFAKEGAVRMDRLVQDLLEFSRIGRNAAASKPTQLGPLLDNVLRVLDSRIAEAGGRVVVPAVLPEIVCCEDEIFLLFQNLIANALKFHPADRAPVIQITVERQGEGWLLGVADNGIGIAPEYFDRIFMIFQRLHTRDKYQGTGIGLAICKKIVERHGGRIWVESVPGEGSTFHFTIPDAGSATARAKEAAAE